MSDVAFEVSDGVATITLSAPERRNALTPAMVAALVEACDRADNDSSVGVVILTALGPVFCAGAHREGLARVAADPTADANFREMTAAYEAFGRVASLRAPSIAAIRGPAVGAGVNLALSTDLRVIAEDARLIAGFIRIGIHPGGGHFNLVGRLAGREAAAALGVFGEEITGIRAAELGMAWRALPSEDVEPYARSLAVRVAGDPELARAVVQSMRLELGPPPLPWKAAMSSETALQMWSLRRREADRKD
jgi:enoyl-CoA hydratase